MSLKHAILGFLGYRPRTGYDLKRLFDGTVRDAGAGLRPLYLLLGSLIQAILE